MKQDVSKALKERTNADMVEVEIDDEYGHVTFEIVYANRSDETRINDLLENFE